MDFVCHWPCRCHKHWATEQFFHFKFSNAIIFTKQYQVLDSIMLDYRPGKQCQPTITGSLQLLEDYNKVWETELTMSKFHNLKNSIYFLAFDFCRFCVVFFFCPRNNSQWPQNFKNFCPRFDALHFCPILILEREPVFPFFTLSWVQRNYWYHFFNVFGLTRSLTGDWTHALKAPHLKPALYH